MKNILIVEDEKEIADLLEIYLNNENYNVFKLYSAMGVLDCIKENGIDLAILDVMLPDDNGFSLCQKIRKEHMFPIIMLTAKGEEHDKVQGLTYGADDYITKPFKSMEVIARVKAQLRRYTSYNKVKEDIIVHKGLIINTNTYECILDGKPLNLTPTEFTLLKILCEEKGKVVSSENLFHRIWKEEYYDKQSNSIPIHIRHLRKKINDDADNPKYIKTVWGVGYKIEK